MRSSTLLDPTDEVRSPAERTLLVLWQHPATREIVPIGRLSHDAERYSFVYSRAAGAVKDFRPLPGLQRLHQRYDSDRLPAVFSQRVMESARPDFADYMRTLGLDPVRATPWEQIVQSGGGRAGDTLQFMQIPTVDAGKACARFLASGVRHVPGAVRVLTGKTVQVSAAEHEAALQALTPGMRVFVVREDNNPQDPKASVVTHGGVPLGYIPRLLSTSVRELLSHGPVEPLVVRVGDTGSPSHLRLVLDLEVEAPPGFVFDRDGLWDPLPQPGSTG